MAAYFQATRLPLSINRSRDARLHASDDSALSCHPGEVQYGLPHGLADARDVVAEDVHPQLELRDAEGHDESRDKSQPMSCVRAQFAGAGSAEPIKQRPGSTYS